jgi:hypothetical protein
MVALGLVECGFQSGAAARTPISYSEVVEDTPGYARGDSLLAIGSTEGSSPGLPQRRGYEIGFHDITRPSEVRVNGRPVDENAWS